MPPGTLKETSAVSNMRSEDLRAVPLTTHSHSDEFVRDALLRFVTMQPVEGRRYLFVDEMDWASFRVERVEQNEVTTVVTLSGWSKKHFGGDRMSLGDWNRFVRERHIIDGDTEFTTAD